MLRRLKEQEGDPEGRDAGVVQGFWNRLIEQAKVRYY